MPRRHPTHQRQPASPLLKTGHQTTQHGADGTWTVRAVTAAAARKTYRCPGCEHQIPPGTAHTLAWPDDEVDDRRHWHTPCWRSRNRCRPTRRR